MSEGPGAKAAGERPDLDAGARARRALLLGALLFVLFAVYASLLPLELRQVPFDRAVARLASLRGLPPVSRGDLIANVALALPLGFCVAGALRCGRRGALRHAAAVIAATLIAGTLGLAVELAQVFFRDRVPSLLDVAAQAAGGFSGAIAWLATGEALVEVLSRRPGTRGPAEVALWAYAALFAAGELVPFDLTLRPGQVLDKYRAGRIALDPLAELRASGARGARDAAIDAAAAVPIGILAGLVASRRGARPGAAAGVAIGGVVALEAAQVLVLSRFASSGDAIWRSIGVVAGAIAARRIGGPAPEPGGGGPRGTAPISAAGPIPLAWARVALTLWCGVLLLAHWFPFDFTLDRALVKSRLPVLGAMPFRAYVEAPALHAVIEIARKILLAAAFGVLLRLSARPPATAATARLEAAILLALAGAAFAAIEVGQVLLPSRYPDPTDVILGTIGAAAGLAIAGRARRGLRAAD